MNYSEIQKLIDNESIINICDIILNNEENNANIFYENGKKIEINEYNEKVKIFKKSREYILSDIKINNYDCIIELFSGWGKNIFYLFNEIKNNNIDFISCPKNEKDIEIQNLIKNKFYPNENLKINLINFDRFGSFIKLLENKYKNILFLTFSSDILYIDFDLLENLLNEIKFFSKKYKFISLEPCGWQISSDSITEKKEKMQNYGNGYYNLLKNKESIKEIIFYNIFLDYFGIGDKNNCETLIEWVKYDDKIFEEKKITLEPLLFHNYNTRGFCNVIFKINEFINEGTVFEFTKKYEGDMSSYFNVLQVDNKIKLYYRACSHMFFHNHKFHDSETQYLCYAESYDGMTFFKPNLHLYKFENDDGKNNIIMKNHLCHNFFITYLKETKKYIGLGGLQLETNGLFLLLSDDGLLWDGKKIFNGDYSSYFIIRDTGHINHFDTLNVILYNEITKEYTLYLRDNPSIRRQGKRKVQYSKSNDYINFPKCKELYIFGCAKDDIYAPGIFIYPNTKYYIGITPIYNDSNRFTSLIISEDGNMFQKIYNDVFNLGNNSYPAQGMCIFNNKMMIYTEINTTEKNNYLLCYSNTINRIGYIENIYKNEIGTFKSKNLLLKNNFIYINCDSLEGYIKLELYSLDNELITETEKISENNFNIEIKWINDINNFEKEYYIKFILFNSKIFSYSYF